MAGNIPYATIVSAKAGDAEAMAAILRHYAPYIASYSKRTFYDEYDSRYELVDETIRQRIEAKLMLQIVYRFDPTRLPPTDQPEH